MSVPNQIPIVTYTANGITSKFPISFDLHDHAYLVVTVNKEKPTKGAYSVDGGEVVFRTPPNNGDEVTLARDTVPNRDTNFSSYDNSMRPEVFNYDFDKLWHYLQEQNLVDAISLARIKEEIEWRRTHDFNYDMLAQVREKQLFGGLKQYVDTFIAATNPNIFGGVTAGVVFALDQKSVQTHLEEIADQLEQSRQELEDRPTVEAMNQALSSKADTKDVEKEFEIIESKIKAAERGLLVFSFEADLLKEKPLIEPVAGKAYDTRKEWIWETRAPETDPKWWDTGLSDLDQANQHTNEAQDFLNQQTASKLSVQFDFQTKQILPSFFILNEHHKTIVPSDNSNQFNLDFFSSPDQQSLIFLDEEFKILNEQGGQDISFDDLPISEFNSKDVYLDSHFIKQIRKNYPAFYFNTSQATITHADDVYSFYDQMLHENPDYITKELLGNDTEGYPIYSYVFTPPEKLYWGHSKSSVEPPLFVITAGIHGAEKMGIIAVISFFLNLVNEWRTEQHYDKLRFACKFVVVPACNPYGIKANTRGNINGVDLNRNFDSNWGESGSNDPSNVGYRGPSAFSETESRLLATIPDKYPNATLFLDIHQQGEIYLFWFGTILDSTKGIVVDSLDEMITFVHKQIKPNANLQLQMGRIGYNGPGTLAQYFQLVKKVPTILIEASSSNHPMLTGQWLHARVVAEKSILTVIHKTYEKEVRQRSISLI